ncbi:hypothetical protein N7491_007943 [Penicillium cf. griseofulvum]|uniref:Uncharacterized protein n=1 Tax=Penicillium cf. griseofulvum TaxID=2972120 RepID=A0A9W9M531_9EURO|nr:hypothetical protein N7472_009030 [Penicillium cf. griseofulvum]KAJ5427501.1 hypothetical protein N7491_007943 [Penicillium cf. griseofulvum]
MISAPQPYSLDQSQARHHPVTGIEYYNSVFPLSLITYLAFIVGWEPQYQAIFAQSSEMEVSILTQPYTDYPRKEKRRALCAASKRYQWLFFYKHRIDSRRPNAMSGGMRVYHVPDAANAISSVP